MCSSCACVCVCDGVCVYEYVGIYVSTCMLCAWICLSLICCGCIYCSLSTNSLERVEK